MIKFSRLFTSFVKIKLSNRQYSTSIEKEKGLRLDKLMEETTKNIKELSISTKRLDASMEEATKIIKELSISTKRLDASTSRLDKSEKNRSRANELAIERCLLRRLKKDYKDISTVNLPGGKIKKNKQNTMVQWDSIFVGSSVRNSITSIFFVEVKEIPHANDIVYISNEPKQKLDLNDKILKTDEFYTTILSQDDSNRSEEFQMQNIILRRYSNCPRIYVYASGKMNEDIINSFKSLTLPQNASVTCAQCDHYNGCEYTKMN